MIQLGFVRDDAMTPMDFVTISELVSGAPVALLLVAALIGVVREWWVPGPTHRRQLAESLEREREWRELALTSTGLAERAVDVAGRRAGSGGQQ